MKEKMAAHIKEIESKLPEAVMAIEHRDVEDLKNSGIAEKAIHVGEKAPDFSLKNTEGEDVVLSKLLAKGPVVLSFYRGSW
jgi:hypothetical protein